MRQFKKRAVPDKIIEDILEAARWAPSGLNNQPWKFMVLEGEKKDALAEFTHYSHIIKGANKVILVFLDGETMYNEEKDLMAIGACIQNMLLCIHAKKLGACWLGEILNQRKSLQKKLNIPKNLQFEAAIALGYPLRVPKARSRKPLSKLKIKQDG